VIKGCAGAFLRKIKCLASLGIIHARKDPENERRTSWEWPSWSNELRRQQVVQAGTISVAFYIGIPWIFLTEIPKSVRYCHRIFLSFFISSRRITALTASSIIRDTIHLPICAPWYDIKIFHIKRTLHSLYRFRLRVQKWVVKLYSIKDRFIMLKTYGYFLWRALMTEFLSFDCSDELLNE